MFELFFQSLDTTRGWPARNSNSHFTFNSYSYNYRNVRNGVTSTFSYNKALLQPLERAVTVMLGCRFFAVSL